MPTRPVQTSRTASGHAAKPMPPFTVPVGNTDDMNLDRNPFVATALADLAEGRTHVRAVGDLLDSANSGDLNLAQEHLLTDTFLSLWNNLTAHAAVRGTVLAVMRGISIEPRHPAYRVSPTSIENILQAQVGTDITLVFHIDGTAITWLSVLHEH